MVDHEGRPGQRGEDARLSFEQSSLPQAFTDLEGRFTSVNAALQRTLGRPEGWFLGRKVTSVLHPLDDPELDGRLARLQTGDTDAIGIEVVARRADGRPLPLLVNASLIRTVDGSPRCVVLHAHDLAGVRSAQERLESQERFFHILSQRASDAALVTDVSLTVVFVSPAAAAMLDCEPLDMLSVDAFELLHPVERADAVEVVDRVVAEPDATGRCVTRIRVGAGAWRWVELTVVNCLADPDVGGLVLNLRDVTVERETQRAMRDSEARYRAIVETAQEGIIVTAADGRVVLTNDSIAKIVGLKVEEIRRSVEIRKLVARASEPEGDAVSTPGGALRRELAYLHPDGVERTLSVSVSPLPAESAEAVGVLVMVSDVTESHRMQEKLRHQALHDQLTGLPNRYLFEDRLEMAAARQDRRQSGSTAVMFIDLDGFKTVNDTHGHAIGDQILRTIARRLLDAMRSADTVARLGGDEFAIICEGLDADAAGLVAERIQDEVLRPVELGGRAVGIGGSVGIALFPPHDPARVLHLADTAMYQAKRLGGGGVIIFDGDQTIP